MSSRPVIPFAGQISSAPQKRFKELVVFVPFFGGGKLHMRRHVDFVNELGFDALTFNLSFDENFWVKRIPFSRTKKFGIRYKWGDEVEDVLNAVPGDKIIFAFSNPSACAIDATARRKAKDIKALITDSGPFIHMLRCSWNLLTHQYVVKNRLLRLPAAVGLGALWGVEHSRDLKNDLKNLPDGFPVLSIRGWQDDLVPVSAIDGAYANAKARLQYETLALPMAGHLNGLKDFYAEYKPRVAGFLEKATKTDAFRLHAAKT